MLKSNFKFLFLTISCVIAIICLQDNLQAKPNLLKQVNVNSSFEDKSAAIEQLVKKMNNPRIVYKNGQVIFYPNPNTQKIFDQLQLITIVMFICAITVILLPISIILLIVEIVLVCNLSEKNSLAGSLTPHIILDEYTIKIGNQKTFWVDINNITKEEITTYSNGWEKSKKNILHFYDKYLNSLFKLDDQDEYIEMSFDKLVTLIYYFLEESKTEFTQNVQKTTISENTTYYPVYTYR